MTIRPEEIQGLRKDITELTVVVSSQRTSVTSLQRSVEILSGSVSDLGKTVAVLEDRHRAFQAPERPCIELAGHLKEHNEDRRIAKTAEANARAGAWYGGIAHIVVTLILAAAGAAGAAWLFVSMMNQGGAP